MFRALNFRSDRLRTKRTKFGPHENFPLYGRIIGDIFKHNLPGPNGHKMRVHAFDVMAIWI